LGVVAVAVRGEFREELVLRIEPQERTALEQLSETDPEHRDPEEIAKRAMRDGLASQLAAAGLPSPYAPTPAAAGNEAADTRRAEAHRRRGTRALFLGGAAIGLIVTLVGGYGYRWSWTGFSDNNQLWDWMKLLILPVAFGTFAVWLKHGSVMSGTRRAVLAAAVVGFGAFVAAGYLVPLNWTGFKGNTLWDWLTLLLLPLALMTVKLWPSTARELGTRHVVFGLLLSLALVITLVGGYAGGWAWTGYPGNTLWDWLSLVLGPVVIATLVIPAAVRWVSGDAERAAERSKDSEPPAHARQGTARE
jgi:hypothetical protein